METRQRGKKAKVKGAPAPWRIRPLNERRALIGGYEREHGRWWKVACFIVGGIAFVESLLLSSVSDPSLKLLSVAIALLLAGGTILFFVGWEGIRDLTGIVSPFPAAMPFRRVTTVFLVIVGVVAVPAGFLGAVGWVQRHIPGHNNPSTPASAASGHDKGSSTEYVQPYLNWHWCGTLPTHVGFAYFMPARYVNRCNVIEWAVPDASAYKTCSFYGQSPSIVQDGHTYVGTTDPQYGVFKHGLKVTTVALSHTPTNVWQLLIKTNPATIYFMVYDNNWSLSGTMGLGSIKAVCS